MEDYDYEEELPPVSKNPNRWLKGVGYIVLAIIFWYTFCKHT